MKNPSNPECDYSFEMLYRAAYGKSLDTAKKKALQALPQKEINNIIKDWAEKARWICVERIGEKGVRYTAFYPPQEK